MKTLYTLLAVLLVATGAVSLTAFRPAKDKLGLCKVQKINGIEVYIMCEPVNDYEMLGDASTGGKAASLLTGGLINESISDKVAQFVKRAQTTHPTMDGVIYTAGKRIGAFNWVKKPTGSKKGMATAQKVGGHYAFVMAEPEADYMTLSTVSGKGVKWKSIVTGGIANNSIEEDVAKLMAKAMETNPRMDGLIYSAGKTATTIKWEKE